MLAIESLKYTEASREPLTTPKYIFRFPFSYKSKGKVVKLMLRVIVKSKILQNKNKQVKTKNIRWKWHKYHAQSNWSTLYDHRTDLFGIKR